MGLCLEPLAPACSSIWSHHRLPFLADGLFGQCQVGSVQDRPYFQVTSPVLQRLQDVLRHLMAQGEGGSVMGGVTVAARGCQAALPSGTRADWDPTGPGVGVG